VIKNKSNDPMQTATNRDNAHFQPLTGNLCDGRVAYIGYVDDVNGSPASEVPEFAVTRAELLELAKYWQNIFLSRTFFIFETDQIGSTDIRVCPYAERRVARIIELLGDEAIRVVREVEDEHAKRVGVRVWKEFRAYLGPKHVTK
jgi:hypothetical protein